MLHNPMYAGAYMLANYLDNVGGGSSGLTRRSVDGFGSCIDMDEVGLVTIEVHIRTN